MQSCASHVRRLATSAESGPPHTHTPPIHTLCICHLQSTGAMWTCRTQVAGVAGRLAAYEELEEPSMGAEDFSFLAGIYYLQR